MIKFDLKIFFNKIKWTISLTNNFIDFLRILFVVIFFDLKINFTFWKFFINKIKFYFSKNAKNISNLNIILLIMINFTIQNISRINNHQVSKDLKLIIGFYKKININFFI